MDRNGSVSWVTNKEGTLSVGLVCLFVYTLWNGTTIVSHIVWIFSSKFWGTSCNTSERTNPYAFGPSNIKPHVNVMSLIPILFRLKMAFTSLQNLILCLRNHLV